MEEETYRVVPHRFLMSESSADICKLEKLTNLFPEMKAIIELELFKINNLSRMLTRLSTIYTVVTAMDNRDESVHLFLGPYHLSLGPAIFGTFRFKNITTALLSSANPKTKSAPDGQNSKRRHDAVLRRFRRLVRKLILVKSTVDQLRLASILIPYNQYELYNQGVYDLALAGHLRDPNSLSNDKKFTEELNNFRSIDNSQDKTSLNASGFVKINTLLNLLFSNLQQPENSIIPANLSQIKTNDTNIEPTKESESKTFIDTATVCCAQHSNNPPLVVIPVAHQTPLQLSTRSHPKHNDKRDSRKKGTGLPRHDTTGSLPDAVINDVSGTNISSSTSIKSAHSLNQIEREFNKPSNTEVQYAKISSSELLTNEDAFVNRMSTLLTSYLLSRSLNESKAITSPPTDNHEKNPNLGDTDSNEFDKLLQRIKKVVHTRLAPGTSIKNKIDSAENIHQNLSPVPSRKTTLNSDQESSALRTVSLYDVNTAEPDLEQYTSSGNKSKFHVSSKSQSLEDVNFIPSTTKLESNDN